MLTAFTLALLSSPTALAEADSGSPDVTFEAYGQQLASEVGPGVGLGLGARLAATRSTFVALEGRSVVGSHWIGRGTVGLDIFGGSETIDLTAGLFLGTTGTWVPPGANVMDPTAGFELGIGLNVGPVRGRYRHADGFKGPLESHLTENEWRLGYEVGRLQVFGQYLRFNPGDAEKVGGLGLGASMTF